MYRVTDSWTNRQISIIASLFLLSFYPYFASSVSFGPLFLTSHSLHTCYSVRPNPHFALSISLNVSSYGYCLFLLLIHLLKIILPFFYALLKFTFFFFLFCFLLFESACFPINNDTCSLGIAYSRVLRTKKDFIPWLMLPVSIFLSSYGFFIISFYFYCCCFYSVCWIWVGIRNVFLFGCF